MATSTLVRKRCVLLFLLCTACQSGLLQGDGNGKPAGGEGAGEAAGSGGNTEGGTPGTMAGSDGAGTTAGPIAFAVLPLAKQLSKVKTVLVGSTVTADELAAAETSGLKSLIAQWQQTPEYQAKMITFLSNALQQSQVAPADYYAAIPGRKLNTLKALQDPLMQNIHEMMARTVLALDAKGQPFSVAMTTHTFLMTPPLQAWYALIDYYNTNDLNKVYDYYGKKAGYACADSNFPVCVASTVGTYALADFNNWREVVIRQPNGAEASTLPRADMRPMTTMVLKAPFQGFMTTPAFLWQWHTNPSNSSRVTMNQTLIVALGHAFDGADQTKAPSLAAIDAAHVAPNTSCYGCHLTMDPMRQIFRQFLSIGNSVQTDPVQKALPGQFAYGGVSMQVSKFDDLGLQLAAHPMMPLAWVKKVCAYANDAPCLDDDPEVMALAASFAEHKSFSQLVQEVFSSPVTTYAASTLTTEKNGVMFAIAKQDHLCPLLSQRLKIDDICGLQAGAQPAGNLGKVQSIAAMFPANGFSRGSIEPPQQDDPTLFFRAGGENVCAALAAQLVDATGSGFASSTAPVAVANMVHNLMGILPGAGDDEVAAILMSHFSAAKAAGNTAADALRSTFVVACQSPSVMGIAL